MKKGAVEVVKQSLGKAHRKWPERLEADPRPREFPRNVLEIALWRKYDDIDLRIAAEDIEGFAAQNIADRDGVWDG